jgi:hypothetical protein
MRSCVEEIQEETFGFKIFEIKNSSFYSDDQSIVGHQDIAGEVRHLNIMQTWHMSNVVDDHSPHH